MRISTRAALAAAGIVSSGVIGGLTYAAVSTPAAASGGTGTTVATPAASPAPTAGGRLAFGRHRLLSRIEHGELTLQTRNGTRTVDLQRGTVTAVSSDSLSVRSPDGFAGTYTVGDATRVRTRSGLTSISAVHEGDRVFVVGSGGKALRVIVPQQ